jgi:hypothetical protein
MAFDEFTLHRIQKVVGTFVESRRPPPHIRKELDLAFRIDGQSVLIFEVRPHWKMPEEIMENLIAKATYVKTQDLWNIYWMRQTLKWHSYPLLPQVDTIEEFLEEVAEDPSACFWG